MKSRNRTNGPCIAVAILAIGFFPAPSPALEFIFTTTGFSTPALDALDRAAAMWSSRIDDPIEVNITTEFKDLSNASIIGTASSRLLRTNADFTDVVIDQLKLDALAEADDGIVAALPALIDLKFALPPGITFADQLSGTKANFKALGFSNLDSMFGLEDAEINFNTEFDFDFNNSDGVTPGFMDFETVAAHELGHALGFFSSVDALDMGITDPIVPTLLDLFRFGPDFNPSNATEFNTFERNLIPGVATFFDDTDDEYLFSTGVTQGDGAQASHWKDTNSIGVLDPTLETGQIFPVSEADFRALDLSGYDISAVPLPPGFLLFSSALLLLGYQNIRRSLPFLEWKTNTTM